jgi:hypothetical protein
MSEAIAAGAASAPRSEWQAHVLPHGELTELAPGLWQVTGRMKSPPLPRNMIVHRLADGGLVLHSVVALDDAGMAKLESLGRPRVMIVPSGYHRLDAGVYKARYPDLEVVAPAGSRDRVAEKVKVDGSAEERLPPLGVQCHSPTGLRGTELIFEVQAGTTRALLVNDVLFNIPQHLPGFGGWLLKVLGSTGYFGITRIGRVAVLKDKAAFKQWLMALAERTDIGIVTVSHGDPVVGDVGPRLREAAARL